MILNHWLLEERLVPPPPVTQHSTSFITFYQIILYSISKMAEIFLNHYHHLLLIHYCYRNPPGFYCTIPTRGKRNLFYHATHEAVWSLPWSNVNNSNYSSWRALSSLWNEQGFASEYEWKLQKLDWKRELFYSFITFQPVWAHAPETSLKNH